MELEDLGTCTLDQDGCSTCGDMVVPVRVLELTPPNALVEDRLGQQTEVAIDFLMVKPNDIILVHMGVAIAKAETP